MIILVQLFVKKITSPRENNPKLGNKSSPNDENSSKILVIKSLQSLC